MHLLKLPNWSPHDQAGNTNIALGRHPTLSPHEEAWKRTHHPGPFPLAPSKAAVPSLFGTRDRFCGRQIFHGLVRGGWFWDDSSALHLLCPLFLLSLCQLYLKSSGIRSQRLGAIAHWQPLMGCLPKAPENSPSQALLKTILPFLMFNKKWRLFNWHFLTFWHRSLLH